MTEVDDECDVGRSEGRKREDEYDGKRKGMHSYLFY